MRKMKSVPYIKERELRVLARELDEDRIDTHMYNHDFTRGNPNTVDFRYVPFNMATK